MIFGAGDEANWSRQYVLADENRKLREEIDKLKRIILQELVENDGLGSEFVYVMALKEQNKKMREALEWYADEALWEQDYSEELNAYVIGSSIHKSSDCGQRARQALKELE